MRIVFVLAVADLAGGARTISIHARGLKRLGHQVTVVSVPPPVEPLRSRVRSVLRGRGWPRSGAIGPSHLDHPEIDHRRLDRFRAVTDRDIPDADVVVATWWLTAEWVAGLSPAKGAKVHFIQGDESDIVGQPRERAAATWTLPMHRIVCSRWLAGLVADRAGDRATSLAPNGVDLAHFDAPIRGKRDRPTVGFIFGDAPIKGYPLAVEAVRRLQARVPALEVVVFGAAPVSGTQLPRFARFTLRPPQDAIPGLYASADAWLWPSLREGFGLPLLEALACRTPVVATPAGAAPDILAGGGGVLLASADAEQAAAALERILALPDGSWRTLSAEARGVAEGHGWEAASRAFEAGLQTAISRQREKRSAGAHE